MTITEDLFKNVNGFFDEDRSPPEGEEGWNSRPRFELLSASDALQPQPPTQWIVDQLISAGSINMFFGEGGSKKTWVMLSMAVSVALGRQFLNFDTTQGSVLIVDEESGRRRMLRRLGDALRGELAGPDTPVFCVSLAGLDLGRPHDLSHFHQLIVSTKARLVFIDALADVMAGRDENSVKDVQPVFLALRKIAEDTQAAIVIIHHANKGGSYRGSSAIKGALDLLVNLESATGSSEIAFRTEKARDTLAANFGASAVFMPDSFTLSANKTVPAALPGKFTKAERYVLAYLLEHGASAIKDISSNAQPLSVSTARNSTYDLATHGFLLRTNGGGQGVRAEYDLTDKGRRAARKL